MAHHLHDHQGDGGGDYHAMEDEDAPLLPPSGVSPAFSQHHEPHPSTDPHHFPHHAAEEHGWTIEKIRQALEQNYADQQYIMNNLYNIDQLAANIEKQLPYNPSSQVNLMQLHGQYVMNQNQLAELQMHCNQLEHMLMQMTQSLQHVQQQQVGVPMDSGDGGTNTLCQPAWEVPNYRQSIPPTSEMNASSSAARFGGASRTTGMNASWKGSSMSPPSRRPFWSSPDAFYSQFYSYFLSQGLATMILSELCTLLTLGFTIGLSIFLMTMVSWSSLWSCTDEESCLALETAIFPSSPFHHTPTLWSLLVAVYSIVACAGWCFRVWWMWEQICDAMEMEVFYHKELGIDQIALRSMTWYEVLERLLETHNSGKYPVEDAPQITIESVVWRLMRKENYWIALINKDKLNLRLPWFLSYIFHGTTATSIPQMTANGISSPERFYLTKTLQWTLQYTVLDNLISNKMDLSNEFLDDIEGLQQRFKLFGWVHLLLLPSLLLFLLFSFFLSNAQTWHTNRSYLGPRQWSRFAEWKFREFNELPHQFQQRMSRAEQCGRAYLLTFHNPFLLIGASTLAYLSGALVAVLLVISLISEGALLYVHIGDHNLLWYLGICTAIFAGCRSVISSSGISGSALSTSGASLAPFLSSDVEWTKVMQSAAVNDVGNNPAGAKGNTGRRGAHGLRGGGDTAVLLLRREELLMQLCSETHDFPSHWEGQASEMRVRDEVSRLLPYKAKVFLLEMLSVVLTPMMLWWSLPECVPEMLEFLRAHTQYVDGIGPVCDYSLFGDKYLEGVYPDGGKTTPVKDLPIPAGTNHGGDSSRQQFTEGLDGIEMLPGHKTQGVNGKLPVHVQPIDRPARDKLEMSILSFQKEYGARPSSVAAIASLTSPHPQSSSDGIEEGRSQTYNSSSHGGKLPEVGGDSFISHFHQYREMQRSTTATAVVDSVLLRSSFDPYGRSAMLRSLSRGNMEPVLTTSDDVQETFEDGNNRQKQKKTIPTLGPQTLAEEAAISIKTDGDPHVRTKSQQGSPLRLKTHLPHVTSEGVLPIFSPGRIGHHSPLRSPYPRQRNPTVAHSVFYPGSGSLFGASNYGSREDLPSVLLSVLHEQGVDSRDFYWMHRYQQARQTNPQGLDESISTWQNSTLGGGRLNNGSYFGLTQQNSFGDSNGANIVSRSVSPIHTGGRRFALSRQTSSASGASIASLTGNHNSFIGQLEVPASATSDSGIHSQPVIEDDITIPPQSSSPYTEPN